MFTMRAALVPLALAAVACASHPTPRFDPAVYSKLCSSSLTDRETAKHGGCVLNDQGVLRTLPGTTRPGRVVRPVVPQ
jgi:hypothetical protein